MMKLCLSLAVCALLASPGLAAIIDTEPNNDLANASVIANSTTTTWFDMGMGSLQADDMDYFRLSDDLEAGQKISLTTTAAVTSGRLTKAGPNDDIRPEPTRTS